MTRQPDPKRPLLIAGVALVAIGAGLEIASRTQPAGGWLDLLAPWIMLAGSVLTLLYFVVRRAATSREPDRDKRESMLFGQSTTMQAPPSDEDERRS